jgi:predicted transcriptional regulator
MPRPLPHTLSRRERQILDALFRLGSGTVAEVLTAIPDPPSYSAVRALLRTMESKGHLRHREDGPRYVYEPVARLESARRSALAHLVRTFFDGSTEDAVAALLDARDGKLSEPELSRIAKLIDHARSEGR